MKRIIQTSLLLLIFFLPLLADAAEIKLIWGAVTTNTDGSPCNDLAGYRMYLGDNSGGPYAKISDVPVSAEPMYIYPTPPDSEKTYFFVITAYDTAGNESGYSNEVSVFVDESAPAIPGGLKIFVIVTP